MDIRKAVWIFEVSSNVEADSTEQLDEVRNLDRYGMNLLLVSQFCYLVAMCVLSLAELQWLQD